MTDAQQPSLPPQRNAALEQRVQQLAAFYRQVQAERMQGIPILNPALSVEAVGFRLASGDVALTSREASETVAEGVLITPWFMSLVRLPLAVLGHGGGVGRKQVHAFGSERFEFIGAHDPALGLHQTCTLFSNMHEFGQQALARQTAQEVIAALPPPATASAGAAAPTIPAAVPSRRAFLFGRPAAAQGCAS